MGDRASCLYSWHVTRARICSTWRSVTSNANAPQLPYNLCQGQWLYALDLAVLAATRIPVQFATRRPVLTRGMALGRAILPHLEPPPPVAGTLSGGHRPIAYQHGAQQRVRRSGTPLLYQPGTTLRCTACARPYQTTTRKKTDAAPVQNKLPKYKYVLHPKVVGWSRSVALLRDTCTVRSRPLVTCRSTLSHRPDHVIAPPGPRYRTARTGLSRSKACPALVL